MCNMRFGDVMGSNPAALSLRRWINRDNLLAFFI